ncbi:hypothetical protein V6Z12_A08G275900 [Gossypium hirsutum]
MGAAKLADVVTRFNREDHKRTKHDSQFSKWKVLIGPHDWEDHSVGKEGVARYRVENLPKTASSGLYELAINKPSSRDHNGKLDSDKVLVVYLGEADNVRSRLQQYGRTGAHLGRNDSGINKVCGCFEDIFARGYSIVYRWAPMKNKADARRTEAQLLGTFDYAWNKGSNGIRRHDDILQKLDKHASNIMKLANFSKKHLPFLQKQVGIKIKAGKLVSDNNEFGKYKNGENRNFLLQVFNFSRSRPRLVSNHGGSDENETFSCGVVLDDGSICKRPLVEGRKRCAEHKGKKTRGSSTRSSTKSQPHKEDYPEIEHCSPICGRENKADALRTEAQLLGTYDYPWNKGSNGIRRHDDILQKLDKHASNPKKLNQKQVGIKIKASKLASDDSEFGKYKNGENLNFLPQVFNFSRSRPRLVSNHGGSDKNETFSCGVVLDDGSICKRPPVEGRKRCAEHKGKKTTGASTSSSMKSQPHKEDYPEIEHCSPICGVAMDDGSLCRRQPVSGRKRCDLHKGRRIYSSGSEITSYETMPYAIFNPYSDEKDSNSSLNSNNCSTPICGVLTCNGTPYKRTVNGNGRCWQHLKYSGSHSSSNYFIPRISNYDSTGTSICGAPTRNGSFCRRTVKGNGTCRQH